MNLFQKNLQALQSRHPQWAEQISHLEVDTNRYHCFRSQQGSITLEIRNGDGSKHLWHSRYNPLREAQREIQNLDHSQMYVPLFVGLGLGYSLRELWDNHSHEFTALLILERDPTIFLLALQTTKLHDIVSSDRVGIHIGDDLSTWAKRVKESIPSITSCKLQLIQHSPSCQFYNDFYRSALHQLQTQLRTVRAEFDLMIRNGDQIQKNMWENLRVITQSIALDEVKRKCSKRPAFVIAAGPSLDKNVHHLRNIQNRYLIISVDTAFRTLKKNGIEPHVVVATDPNELNLKHFEGLDPHPDTILAFDAECYSEIPNRWPHRTLYINLDKTEFTRWIEETYGPYGFQLKGGSVGHTAFFLARDLGADPIILVGLDLAFDPQGGKTHSAESALFREHETIAFGTRQTKLGARFQSEAMQENIVWVPGSIQDQVPTSQVMWIYIQQFSEQFAQTQAKVIDATEGGAKLPGTQVIPLQQTIERLSSSPGSVLEFISQWSPKPVPLTELKNELHKIIQQLDSGDKYAQMGLGLANSLSKNISKGEELKQTQEWGQLTEHFSALYHSKEIKIAIEQVMFSAVYQFIQKEWPHEVDKRLQKYKRYFELYLHHSSSFKTIIQNVHDSL